MVIRPDKLGVETEAMVAVICPTCRLPAWANKMKGSEKHQARTVCCGAIVQYRANNVQENPNQKEV